MKAASRPSSPRPLQTGGPTRIAVTRGSPVAQALHLEVVDVAAASAFAVDELMVEETQTQVELLRRAHPCPWCVRIISGIAVIETSRITTR